MKHPYRVVVAGWERQVVLGKEAFKNCPEAVRQAETMRKSKIRSLEKQIAKLQGLKFE